MQASWASASLPMSRQQRRPDHHRHAAEAEQHPGDLARAHPLVCVNKCATTTPQIGVVALRIEARPRRSASGPSRTSERDGVVEHGQDQDRRPAPGAACQLARPDPDERSTSRLRRSSAQPDIGQRRHVANGDLDEEKGAAPDYGEEQQDRPVAAVHLLRDDRRLIRPPRARRSAWLRSNAWGSMRVHAVAEVRKGSPSLTNPMPPATRARSAAAYQSLSSSLMLVLERVRSSTA